MATRTAHRSGLPVSRLLLALTVLLLAVAAWIGVRALLAKQALDDARTSLTTARVALLERRLPDAREAIQAAAEQTEQARSLTGDPLFRALSEIPVAGASLSTVRGIAVAADDLADQVLPGALSVATAVDPQTVRSDNGTIDVAALRRATPRLQAATARAESVRRDLAQLPRTGVIGQVGAARRELADSLDELTGALRSATTALELAPALLGQDRPRRYLVLIQQTGESRGTGGIVGGFVELRASKGRVTVQRTGSNIDLQQGPIPPPPGLPQDWINRYRPLRSLEIWQNVNVSPDLPRVALVAAARWKAQTGHAVNGVVMADARALALILAGSGPVDVGQGQKIAPSELEQFLAVGQYRGQAKTERGQRKERLGTAARAVAARLVGGGGDSQALLTGLTEAVASGHLRMASTDPALRPALKRAGVDGALPQGPAPVAYPVVVNASAGKLDTWLERSIRYQAGPCRGDRRRTTVTTTVTSRPPAGLPEYVTIRGEGQGATQSRTGRIGLSVYATRGAELVAARLDGRPLPVATGARLQLQPGVEDRLPVWTVYLDTPPGRTRALTLVLDEPVVPGEVRIPVQPLAQDLAVSVSATPCTAG